MLYFPGDTLRISEALCRKVRLTNYPKDPAVLKILRRSKFARRSKFTIA